LFTRTYDYLLTDLRPILASHKSKILLCCPRQTPKQKGSLDVTGEEVLHEGWSSYDNLFGVLMITVTEFLENVTDFCGKLFYILGVLA
jgi:hypothetical protein